MSNANTEGTEDQRQRKSVRVVNAGGERVARYQTAGERGDRGEIKADAGRRDDSVFTSLKSHPSQKDKDL